MSLPVQYNRGTEHSMFELLTAERNEKQKTLGDKIEQCLNQCDKVSVRAEKLSLNTVQLGQNRNC